MSDDKPSALQDVRRGLGLLFRAARTVVDRLPTGGVEEVVATSAREVGRAIENVASTIERGVFGKRGGGTEPEKDAPTKQPESVEEQKRTSEGPKPPDGPR